MAYHTAIHSRLHALLMLSWSHACMTIRLLEVLTHLCASTMNMLQTQPLPPLPLVRSVLCCANVIEGVLCAVFWENQC